MNIKFKFIHFPPHRSVTDNKLSAEELIYGIVPPGTLCHVVDGDDGTLLAEGAAYLHPGDNFNRALGRKIAAGRAFKQLAPSRSRTDRSIRGLLWDELFKISPKTQRATL